MSWPAIAPFRLRPLLPRGALLPLHLGRHLQRGDPRGRPADLRKRGRDLRAAQFLRRQELERDGDRRQGWWIRRPHLRLPVGALPRWVTPASHDTPFWPRDGRRDRQCAVALVADPRGPSATDVVVVDSDRQRRGFRRPPKRSLASSWGLVIGHDPPLWPLCGPRSCVTPPALSWTRCAPKMQPRPRRGSPSAAKGHRPRRGTRRPRSARWTPGVGLLHKPLCAIAPHRWAGRATIRRLTPRREPREPLAITPASSCTSLAFCRGSRRRRIGQGGLLRGASEDTHRPSASSRTSDTTIQHRPPSVDLVLCHGPPFYDLISWGRCHDPAFDS